MNNEIADIWKMNGHEWSPLDALQQAASVNWVIDGVIPANSIIWLVGAPSEGKTFVTMGMAASVSSGRPWMGRHVDQAMTIYLAAEGGTDIHVRRAAAELAGGVAGHLCVVQSQPQIAEPEGIAELMGMIHSISNFAIKFDVVGRSIRFMLS